MTKKVKKCHLNPSAALLYIQIHVNVPEQVAHDGQTLAWFLASDLSPATPGCFDHLGNQSAPGRSLSAFAYLSGILLFK